MRISVLTPFYTPDPRPASVWASLSAWLQGLGEQEGPAEVILASSGPAQRDPLAARIAGLDSPLRLVSLHHRFDPDRQPPPSRGAALNEAAAVATGEIFLVLHADSRLPGGALAQIRAAAAAGYRAGAFPKRYEPRPAVLAVQEAWLNRWRLGRWGQTVGTNAVWVARELWTRLPEDRLFEDFALSNHVLRQVGRPGLWLAPQPVTVSAGKYLRTGVGRSLAINAAVLALWRLGVAPDVLAEELYSRKGAVAAEFWRWYRRALRRAWRSRAGTGRAPQP